MILRLPIKLELFNEKGEMVQSIRTTKKSQVRAILHGLSTPQSKTKRKLWAYGICKVYYNKPNDFWNEFTFRSLSQLEAALLTVTEKPLIDFLHDEIPKEYLSKRKPSAAQQAALDRGRTNSKLFKKK